MKLKYYLRGLGIGIAVTALVLTLAGGGKESLTDEEIKARAKELGMVESVTLSQLTSENTSEVVDEEVSETVSEENSFEAEEPSEGISSEENASEVITDEETTEGGTEEIVSEPISENNSEDDSETDSEVASEEISQSPSGEVIDEFVIIEVGGGDGSDTVSRKLEAAGMVEDAQMYDDFLCANGYDKILQTGVHEIPRTADWDTIAEILAGRM
ncbi:MAG: hypothetical protein IJ397_08315 [Lachnospiraceae bacterium]|nr:hypothetical protein [Lachnospiraceae bacterium]